MESFCVGWSRHTSICLWFLPLVHFVIALHQCFGRALCYHAHRRIFIEDEKLKAVVSPSFKASIGFFNTSFFFGFILAMVVQVELKATKVVYVGKTDPAVYPLAKKKQSFEFLREKAHLRPRTNTIGAVARIRNALAYATHRFFQENGFMYVHTPIITAADCEGAGEMFQVTTLLSAADDQPKEKPPTEEEVKALKARIETQGAAVKEAKAAAAQDKNNADLAARSKQEISSLLELKSQLAVAEEALRNVGGVPRDADGKIDYTQDFFGRKAFLTVSGQLNGEYYACGLSNVYTFGPTFRAENSHTARHLAEFWMIEPEMAFCTLEDDMLCAEDYVRYCCNYLLNNCRADLEFIVKMIDKHALERLEQVANAPFKRVSYTEAVALLEDAVKSGKKKVRKSQLPSCDVQGACVCWIFFYFFVLIIALHCGALVSVSRETSVETKIENKRFCFHAGNGFLSHA